MLMDKMLKSYIPVLCLVFMLIAMSCSLYPPFVSEVAPKRPGSILYSSDESGNFEIYIMNLSGSRKIRLTNNSSEDMLPFYIASTNQIGFVSDRSGKFQIYTMELDGSGQAAWKKADTRIMSDPSLSPDGAQVAFIVQYDDTTSDLFVAQSDGTAEKRLSDSKGADWSPSWSPDGKRIVFTSDRSENWEIYIIDVDDVSITQLTENSFYDGHPRWSADGSKILFESDRDGDWEIYVMDTDGANVMAVTENSTPDWMPTWSSDGQWIVYVSGRDGDDEIYIVDVDGKNQSKLTDNKAQDRYPLWIP